MKYMIIRFFVLFGTLNSYMSVAQTTISGVVNSYASVTSIDYGTNSVVLSSVSGFVVGSKAILIQMQGADIDQSQDISFGTVTNLNGCGNYEIVDICKINNKTVYFSYKLQNSYEASGSVQLVSIPYYTFASLNGVLTCMPWNGITGGILILEAETLHLNSYNIDVSAKGFRGAIAVNSSNNCTFISDPSYFTSSTNGDANAHKGEGIAVFVYGKECSRGPQANGGGGGNNHNGGGGGGSNYGYGGGGGQRIKESAFKCGSVMGLNSYALPNSIAANRIFLGGGGGAGHGNNQGSSGENGLNGGGIAIIIAQTVQSAGEIISANAETTNSITIGDGGGGGGAGGTIVMDVETITGNLKIEAKGSDGVSTNNNGMSNCSGPGGGGGGGALLWVSNGVIPSTVSVNTNGGNAGVIATTSQANCVVGSSNGGVDGSSGGTVFIQSIPESEDIFAISTISPSSCYSYHSPSGKYIWNLSGTYFDTVSSMSACDTVYQINLTIVQVDTAITISNGSISSVVSGASYQWYDCENFTLIQGATAQTYTPSTSGYYALQISQDGCTDTSNCHSVIPLGIENTFSEGSLKVFPNPTQNNVRVEFNMPQNSLVATIYTLNGQLVSKQQFYQSKVIELILPHTPGIYYIRLFTESTIMGPFRVVKTQ